MTNLYYIQKQVYLFTLCTLKYSLSLTACTSMNPEAAHGLKVLCSFIDDKL